MDFFDVWGRMTRQALRMLINETQYRDLCTQIEEIAFLKPVDARSQPYLRLRIKDGIVIFIHSLDLENTLFHPRAQK